MIALYSNVHKAYFVAPTVYSTDIAKAYHFYEYDEQLPYECKDISLVPCCGIANFAVAVNGKFIVYSIDPIAASLAKGKLQDGYFIESIGEESYLTTSHPANAMIMPKHLAVEATDYLKTRYCNPDSISILPINLEE